MQNNSLWRKALAIVLVTAMCLCMVACNDEKPKKDNTSSNTKSDVSSNAETTSSEDTDVESEFNSTESTEIKASEPEYTDETPSDDYLSEISSTESVISDPELVISSEATQTQEGNLVVTQKEFVVTAPRYHPGVPGYDLDFTLDVRFNELPLNVEDYIVEANLKGITTSQNVVHVPKDVKESNDRMVLTVTYKKDPSYKCKLTLAFKHWAPTLMEEFEEPLDSSIWNTDMVMGMRTNNPDAVVITNTKIKDGKLQIETKKQDVEFQGKTYHYTGGRLDSSGKFYQKYGCFTSLIKMPEGGASLCSFWMQPQGQYGYDNFFVPTHTDEKLICSEIDIFEHWPSANGKIGTSEHFWNLDGTGANKNNNYQYQIPNYTKGKYYEFTCIWTKYALYYYLDGVLYGVTTHAKSVNSVPGYIVFSSYLAPFGKGADYGGYSGWYGISDPADTDYTMEVEWLHVYK